MVLVVIIIINRIYIPLGEQKFTKLFNEKNQITDGVLSQKGLQAKKIHQQTATR